MDSIKCFPSYLVTVVSTWIDSLVVSTNKKSDILIPGDKLISMIHTKWRQQSKKNGRLIPLNGI